MRPEAAAPDVVGVPFPVHVAVVVPVVGRPLQDRVLKGHRAEKEVEALDRRVAPVALVGEATVVTGRYGEAHEAEENEEQDRLPPADSEKERVSGGAEGPDDRSQREKDDIDPVLFTLPQGLSRSLQLIRDGPTWLIQTHAFAAPAASQTGC